MAHFSLSACKFIGAKIIRSVAAAARRLDLKNYDEFGAPTVGKAVEWVDHRLSRGYNCHVGRRLIPVFRQTPFIQREGREER